MIPCVCPRPPRVLKCWWLGVATSCLASCTGTTSIQEGHPLLAAVDAPNIAKVYFLRPDPGFRGVMDRPLKIRCDDQDLLALAKGQYTLLALKPGVTQMSLSFFTVVGPLNTLTPRSTTTTLTLSSGTTKYLVFELAPGGISGGSTFIAKESSRDFARKIAKDLSPVGLAISTPL